MTNIAVPSELECPITFDIMTDPVRANCLDENPKKPISFFSRIFTRQPPENTTCKGHFFERLALESWLRHNPNCPLCDKKITKAIPDKDLAEKITREFTNLSNAHKKHFEEAEKEVIKQYGNMRDHPIAYDTPDRAAAPVAVSTGLFSHIAFHSHHPLFRAMHAPRVSDSSKYNRVLQHIRNDNLLAAENEADRIITSYFRNKGYQEITKKYLSKYCLATNADSSSQELQNAMTVASKIIDHQMKNALYYKIVQNAILYPRHLVYAKRVALLISNSFQKNRALEKIAEKYLILYSHTRDETKIQNAIRIVNTLVRDFSIQQRLLNNATNAYIRNFKLKKALNLNNSISSTNTKDQNKKNIAKQYLYKNFNNVNFQKASIVANQIVSTSTRDSTYIFIAEKAATNKAYLKSFKTITKISTFTKRLGLYIKVTCKMLLLGLFKTFTTPFKLAYLGLYYLLATFRTLLNRR